MTGAMISPVISAFGPKGVIIKGKRMGRMIAADRINPIFER
jgi:hypothetical protein